MPAIITMKLINIITFILLFLPITSNILCQDQLLDTNKIWYTAIFESEPAKTNTEVIKLGKLQNINDTLYYTVLRSINGNENPDTEYGFIRNDNGKIYYRKSLENKEKLFYDLTIGVGDTIIVYGIQRISNDGFDKSKMKLESTKVDTFYGTPRQRYFFSVEGLGWTIEEQWIEGLGSEYGLLHHLSGLLGPDGYDLRCVYKNNELIYKRHPAIECILLENIDEIKYIKLGNLTPLPNPVSILQILTIDTEYQGSMTLEIFDLIGRRIGDFYFIGNLNLNCYEVFPCPGIYIYKIKHEEVYIKTGKIIVL